MADGVVRPEERCSGSRPEERCSGSRPADRDVSEEIGYRREIGVWHWGSNCGLHCTILWVWSALGLYNMS